jgi:superoxide dismutase
MVCVELCSFVETIKSHTMKQTRKLEGSYINYLMGNNATTPVVGEGATLLMYTDRYPLEVLSVSKDGKRCLVRNLEAVAVGNNLQIGHQSWELVSDESSKAYELRYRHGAWRRMSNNNGIVNWNKVNIRFGKAEYYRDWTY